MVGTIDDVAAAGRSVTAATHQPSTATISVGKEISTRLWVLIVAGIPTGVLVAGVGSRLAMLALRVTSPEDVIGVTSDDGFEIGRFTVGGTYNLLMLGAVVGLIGAAAYRAVQPWLLGPPWFRRVTVAAGSGAVVGSMLIHADGVDFQVLKPTWLAVGLFVAIPALFGAAIAAAVDRVADLAITPARHRWFVPIILAAAFPPTIVAAAFAAGVLAIAVPVRRSLHLADDPPRTVMLGVRAAWLAIALLGLAALVGDVRALV